MVGQASSARDGRRRAVSMRYGIRETSRLRHRAVPRVARAPARRAVARNPIVVRIRLRVRTCPARSRLPRGPPRHRPRRDPAGSARPAGRERTQGAALPGPQGGVLPPRLRSRTRPCSTRSASIAPGSRRDPHSSGGVAVPPPRKSALRGRAREARTRRRCARCRPPAHERAARRRSGRASLPSLVVPEHAIDAQSLVALADLVVSAGGTMNREAVALGVPVYTTFAGRARRGRQCPREQRKTAGPDLRGRARCSRSARSERADRTRPSLLLDLMLSALEG